MKATPPMGVAAVGGGEGVRGAVEGELGSGGGEEVGGDAYIGGRSRR